MGVLRAPVTGSGLAPAWMARVSMPYSPAAGEGAGEGERAFFGLSFMAPVSCVWS